MALKYFEIIFRKNFGGQRFCWSEHFLDKIFVASKEIRKLNSVSDFDILQVLYFRWDKKFDA